MNEDLERLVAEAVEALEAATTVALGTVPCPGDHSVERLVQYDLLGTHVVLLPCPDCGAQL